MTWPGAGAPPTTLLLFLSKRTAAAPDDGKLVASAHIRHWLRRTVRVTSASSNLCEVLSCTFYFPLRFQHILGFAGHHENRILSSNRRLDVGVSLSSESLYLAS